MLLLLHQSVVELEIDDVGFEVVATEYVKDFETYKFNITSDEF